MLPFRLTPRVVWSLLWVYYSAQIVFLGAEFTKVYSRRFGPVVVPDTTVVPLTAAARAAQGMDRSKTIARRKATPPRTTRRGTKV